MRQTADKIKGFLATGQEIFRGNGAYHLAALSYAPEMASVVWEVKQALEKGIFPERNCDASTTAYFLKDCARQPIAVFKLPKHSRKETVREVAAYRLDHGGFAGVPPTVFTTLNHDVFEGQKEGALQLFINNASNLSTHPVNHYSSFCPAQVRRIATLDIRLLNLDRHTSNLLWGEKTLYPIDHGVSLPSSVKWLSFAWMAWPQSATPFSEEEKEYLFHLNLHQDRCMLIEELGVEVKSANLHYFASLLLKKAVRLGWNPYQIGQMMKSSSLGLDLSQEWQPSLFSQIVHTIHEKAKSDDWEAIAYQGHLEFERALNAG